MMFRVGDEVVCVDASPSWVDGRCYFSEGGSYVISGFDTLPPDGSGDLGVYIVGVKTPPYHDDRGWSASRFRKVTKSKTDIQAWLAQPSDYEEPKRDKVKT